MITPLGDNLNLDGWSTEDGGQLGSLPRGRGAEHSAAEAGMFWRVPLPTGALKKDVPLTSHFPGTVLVHVCYHKVIKQFHSEKKSSFGK